MDVWIYGLKFFWYNEDWWLNQNVCEFFREINFEVKFIVWLGFVLQVDDRFLDSKKIFLWFYLVRVIIWVFRFVVKCRDEEKCLELISILFVVKEFSNVEFWFKRFQV